MLAAHAPNSTTMVLVGNPFYAFGETCTKYGSHILIQKREVETLQKTLEKKFLAREGPFYGALEKALEELGVKRQAYQGGTFVGNHVHKILKVKQVIHM